MYEEVLKTSSNDERISLKTNIWLYFSKCVGPKRFQYILVYMYKI